jgi:hypothetical protein
MASIRGSVGKFASRTKQCFNFAPDQFKVIFLLNRIASADAGTEGNLEEDISNIAPGVATDDLVDAIEAFQSGQKLLVDGHVDPGEATITRLSALAAKSKVAGSGFPATERGATQILLNANRPQAGKMIAGAIKALSAVQDEFLLLTMLTRSANAVDALDRWFHVTRTNREKFLPTITDNFTKLQLQFPSVAGRQFPIDFATLLKEQESLIVDGHARLQKVMGFSDPPRGMFFTPMYRSLNASKEFPFEGVLPVALAGIQIHEMAHFFLKAVDGRPKDATPAQCLNIAQSYNSFAMQIELGRSF